ncbi:MAG: hypothetical protein ABI867_20190 [Kofleriaceae bacterium]
MCCFTNDVVAVSGTNIYARLDGDRQVLAYAMSLDTRQPTAMVLPLPVAPGAVHFIDLSGSPEMFSELAQLFETPSRGFGPPQMLSLEVHQVGSFVASFVPTRADFARLDPQFRISDRLFDAVPQYADYGFAVFQLARGKHDVHPMAFTFPTRAPDRLFFPTVHVHDGKVHRTARFDHSLFYQHAALAKPEGVFRGDPVAWQPVRDPYAGVALAGMPIARRSLHGKLANADVWI